MYSASRGAAGLRRSAIVERIQLREEWSALKEVPVGKETRQTYNTKTQKQPKTAHKSEKNMTHKPITKCDKSKEVNEVLRGAVVLVEVGSETRALPLRAALMALGASVKPAWSPLVTHVVWSQGGCRSIRAKARALACQLVSPLWIEACAAEGRRLPEKIFPAPTRPSDLPSPGALKRFLKRAEQENIPLHTLLSESPEGEGHRPGRLRLSSETDQDTTRDTTDPDTTRDTTDHDTTRDTSGQDTSKDASRDATDIEARVNTAPRRKSLAPQTNRPVKSKRKLFTQKEPALLTTDDDTDNETTAGPKKMQPSKMTQRNRKDLAHAERMARMLLGAVKRTQTNKHTQATQFDKQPRIVLTWMSREERHDAFHAIKQLNGKVQQSVDKRTTHIIMGSFQEPENNPLTTITTKTTKESTRIARQSPKTTKNSIPLSMCNKCNSPSKILSKMFTTKVRVEDFSKSSKKDRDIICKCNCDISGIKNISDISKNNNLVFPVELGSISNRINLDTEDNVDNNIRTENPNHVIENDQNMENGQNVDDPNIETRHNDDDLHVEREAENNNLCAATNVAETKPRTVNALLGAVRGCRVLRYEWVLDSLTANRWLPHIGYEVLHLKKISQKARVARSALNRMHKDYAYDVFNGIRVKISPEADQRDAITQLLTLCGAIIHDQQQNVEKSKNNAKQTPNNNKRNKATQNGGKNTIQDGGKSRKNTFSHLLTLTQKQNGGEPNQVTQDGDHVTADFDLTVGKGVGEVSSKWVFDSVAAARLRTIRRYVNS